MFPTVHPKPQHARPLPPDFLACVYESDVNYIRGLVLSNGFCETGGDFFGGWRNQECVVVQCVTGPGPKASLNQLDFSQDEAYTASCAKYVFQKHGMEHLGTWHSHHQLGLPRPSSGDDHTFFEGLQNNKQVSKILCAIAHIVAGQVELPFFMYQPPNIRTHCGLKILPGDNPFRMRLTPNVLAELEGPQSTLPVPSDWFTQPPFVEFMKALHVNALQPLKVETERGEMRLVYALGTAHFTRQFPLGWRVQVANQASQECLQWAERSAAVIQTLLPARPPPQRPTSPATGSVSQQLQPNQAYQHQAPVQSPSSERLPIQAPPPQTVLVPPTPSPTGLYQIGASSSVANNGSGYDGSHPSRAQAPSTPAVVVFCLRPSARSLQREDSVELLFPPRFLQHPLSLIWSPQGYWSLQQSFDRLNERPAVLGLQCRINGRSVQNLPLPLDMNHALATTNSAGYYRYEAVYNN